MADVLFLVVLVAFFALMLALVRLCERIAGRDEPVEATSDPVDDHADATTPGEVPA